MATIDDVVRRILDRADAQPIRWRRSGWEALWDHEPGLPGLAVLDLIDTEVAAAGTIRRSWVRSLADADPVVFLAASAIWGFGNYVRRGRPALRAMLLTPGVAAITDDIIGAARRDAAAGFSALFDGSGGTRVAQLSIAFGSKVVHFAGYDYANPRPLVLDARVYRAVEELAATARVPNPAKRTTGAQYMSYCEWAGEVAGRIGVEPEQVEYSLFIYGGELLRADRLRRR